MLSVELVVMQRAGGEQAAQVLASMLIGRRISVGDSGERLSSRAMQRAGQS